MRSSLLSMLLVSCSTLDLDGALAPQGPWTEIPERARIIEFGEGRLAPDQIALNEEGGASPCPRNWNDELVVMDPGESIGVMVPLREVDLVVYLDREDLESRVVDPVRSDGALLAAGLQVKILEEEGESVRVEFGDEDVVAQVWVPRFAIDQIWIPATDSSQETPSGDVWLRGATAILDQPDGKAFAWVDFFSWNGEVQPEVFWLPATEVSSAQDGYREIRLHRNGFTIHGFVLEEDLSESRNGGRGRSTSFHCGMRVVPSETQVPTVPSGTDLYVEPDGRWIGRTHSPIYRELKGTPDSAWGSLELQTPWGKATAWLELNSEEAWRVNSDQARAEIE